MFAKTFAEPKKNADYLFAENLWVDINLPPNKQIITTIMKNGNFAGMRAIDKVPEFLEMFFVSDDKCAIEIEDVMYTRGLCGVTMKAVPELPPELLKHAKTRSGAR